MSGGVKTLSVSTTIGAILTVNSGASVNLSNANSYTSNSLILGGAIKPSGTWGSTSSTPPATNQDNTFFSGNGLITVTNGANTYYSIASTTWNLNTTWSNTGFLGGAAASTPGAGDFVYIGNGLTVTVSGVETCSV